MPATPLDPLRGEKILAALDLTGDLSPDAVREPPFSSLGDLLLAHAEEYVESLLTPETDREVWGLELTPEQRNEALSSVRAMTGGTVEAGRAATRRGNVQVNLGGGFHHARTEGGHGFCLVNDVAVAIRKLRQEGFDDRILVVDLDLHDGDGTRAIFAEDDSVFTFSVHNRHWSDPDALASLSLELGGEVEDEVFSETLREKLPPILDSHRPKLVFYLAGTDVSAGDPLGNWHLSPRGLLERDRYVLKQVRSREAGMVVLLAGGYGRESWKPSYRFLATLARGNPVLEAPETEEVVLRRYKALSRLLSREELSREPPEEGDGSWGLTEEDLMGALRPGAAAGSESRFLGFYTRHGIELALERSGVLTRLREKGYPEPTLDLDLEGGRDQTLRIWGEQERDHLLVEARLHRRRDLIPDAEVLFVEWLLLQDPRNEFRPDRPPLPGQDHPGLGLLQDAVALFVMVCERLDLDGVAFVPSHYHLAAQSTRYLHFVDPGDEGRFLALREALSGLSLLEATQAVDEGRIRNRDTGEIVEWEPSPMVLPVSADLESRFDEAHDEKARRMRDELDLVVLPPGN
ncbi:MAG: histone deacetylase [Thermoanaerobaculia bacterium]|nr:histone deacetylase [Thermoanaerobaculia bacterium]